MRIFILEDDPSRIFRFIQELKGCEVTLCDSVAQAKAAWRPPYDVVSLDHDLGLRQFVDTAEENTGSGFCRWLALDGGGQVRGKDGRGVWMIHSFNPPGAANMQRLLQDIGIRADLVPFSKDLIRAIKEAVK